MSTDAVVEILRQALLAAFWIAAPLLAIGFVSAIVVSLTQIVTSIQDSAFGSIPRLIVFVLAILLLMPWMVQRMMTYTTTLLGDLGRYAR
jgi:flagellar biosynthetic protein FliQ